MAAQRALGGYRLPMEPTGNQDVRLTHLDQLIAAADAVLQTHIQHGPVFEDTPTLQRDAFAHWQTQSMTFLEGMLGKEHTYSSRFNRQVRQPHSYDVQAGRGILAAVKSGLAAGSLRVGVTTDPLGQVELVCGRFHAVARQLRSRYDGRATLNVADEYDVQNLMHALLRLFFDDVRPEEWTPSYAGKGSRMDFLLKRERIVVEAKKTRPGLGAKEIGTQLIDDITRYAQHPDCRILVCFAYDPDGLITNPRGIENDLRQDTGEMRVRVIIAPQDA